MIVELDVLLGSRAFHVSRQKRRVSWVLSIDVRVSECFEGSIFVVASG